MATMFDVSCSECETQAKNVIVGQGMRDVFFESVPIWCERCEAIAGAEVPPPALDCFAAFGFSQ